MFAPSALGFGDVVAVEHQVALPGHLEVRRRELQRGQRSAARDEHDRGGVDAAVLLDRAHEARPVGGSCQMPISCAVRPITSSAV